MFLCNDPKQKERRRILRNNSTEFEIILWSCLKQRGCGGYKFVRQYGLGGYIVDFYCPAKKLAIELDGSQHAELENKNYDEERRLYLNDLGVRVLRFWNSEVNNNLPGVLAKILEALEK